MIYLIKKFCQKINNLNLLLILLLSLLNFVTSNYCVCTTVECPMIGENKIVMGNGFAEITYQYIQHQNYIVVSEAKGIIKLESLDNGTETTTCTRKYSRMLEDDGNKNCDAGHILARRLGGYGNQPLNIFPQNPAINQGPFNQFESKIYHCIKDANEGYLFWKFYYDNTSSTQPNKLYYEASFDKGCDILREEFIN